MDQLLVWSRLGVATCRLRFVKWTYVLSLLQLAISQMMPLPRTLVVLLGNPPTKSFNQTKAETNGACAALYSLYTANLFHFL
jgi:hypothetical protein